MYMYIIYIPPNELLLCNDPVAILINRVAEKCCCVNTSARISIRQHIAILINRVAEECILGADKSV